MFHLLEPHLQAFLPRQHPNYHNYCGVVTKKVVGPMPSCDIRLDVFRGDEDETVATGMRRNIFTTLKKGEDEPALDLKHVNKEREAEANDLIEKEDAGEIMSEKEFIKLPRKDLLEAKTFTHVFANKKKHPIHWTILSDTEDISGCEFTPCLREKLDDGPKFADEIDSAPQEMPMDEFFLQHLWPSMDGFAARMDECYKDPRARHCRTASSKKTKFHDDTNEDPDWRMKQFALLLIKGATVHGRGASEFWIAGKLCEGSNLDCADFGQCMNVNLFRAMLNALPFMWGEKALWHKDRCDIPWAIFTLFVEAWNEKQKKLLSQHNILIMDETFVAWCPKTTKLGSLPNYSCEPRKPKGLGTVSKDICEAVIGLLTHADPVMAPSIQDKKKFSNRLSHSPDAVAHAVHQPHVAEVLRQVWYTNLHKQRHPFCGGDAWFGSVAACLALKLEEVEEEDGAMVPMGINSAFVVKNNTSCFPRGPLHAVLKARCPKRMIGHCSGLSSKQ